MEQLPDELLASVFKYFEIKDLGRIAVACKSWRNLTENPALRFDIKTIALNNVTIDDVSTITRGIRKCEKLQLTECNIGSTKWSNIIKDISSNLRCIKLINCKLSDIHTNKIFQAAGACEHLEKLVIFSDDPKLNLFNEQGLEPLLQCQKLHTLTIDGLEYSKFEVISALMEKVSRYNFTCLDSTLSRKIVYVNDVRVKGFCRNVEGIPKLFPHAEQHNEKYPNGLYVHDIEYAPVKWIFKAETYQIIQREKMYLADRDENIVESLEDLSTDMQNRAKALFKTQDRVYVMLIHIKEYSLRRSGELLHEAQLEYDFKDRPPF